MVELTADYDSGAVPRRRSKLSVSGGSVVRLLLLIPVIALVFVALFAGQLSPFPPLDGQLADKLLPPAFAEGGRPAHFLGTDQLGRDLLSRIIYGTQISLLVSALAIGFSAVLGTAMGLIAGFFGKFVDALLMRLTDVALSIPNILVAIVVAAAVGPSTKNAILIIGLLLWPRFARQIRGEALAAKQMDYVTLARIGGCSPLRIIVKHIFPNVVPTLLVLCTLNVGYVIILEASLSFLGVGVPPPTPTWGGIVASGRAMIASAWWIALFPGLAILITVLCMNFLGDWVRDRLDPKLRQV